MSIHLLQPICLRGRPQGQDLSGPRVPPDFARRIHAQRSVALPSELRPDPLCAHSAPSRRVLQFPAEPSALQFPHTWGPAA